VKRYMLALIAVGALTGCSTAAVPRWEYTIASPADEELAQRLKAMGAAGWEIVSARRATSSEGGHTSASYEMIFKRPLAPRTADEILSATPVPK